MWQRTIQLSVFFPILIGAHSQPEVSGWRYPNPLRGEWYSFNYYLYTMEQLTWGPWMSCSYGWSHTSMVGCMSYQNRTRPTDNLSSCWRYLHQCVPYVSVIVDGVVEVWLVCFHSPEFQYNPHCLSSVNYTNRLYYVLKTGSDGTLMQSKREFMIILQHHIGSYSIILGMVIAKMQDRNNIVGILGTIFRIWIS